MFLIFFGIFARCAARCSLGPKAALCQRNLLGSFFLCVVFFLLVRLKCVGWCVDESECERYPTMIIRPCFLWLDFRKKKNVNTFRGTLFT